jgi:hypothetical protein
MGEARNAYSILVGKRQLGKRRKKWEDLDLGKIECEVERN